MKLFDRIFHPEKVEALEKCAKQWDKIYPMLTSEQFRYLEIPSRRAIITILPSVSDYDERSTNLFNQFFSLYVTGEDYKELLKTKVQLDSLKEIGLTDEQKLYLELIEGEKNG